jgi:hypothetical protein
MSASFHCVAWNSAIALSNCDADRLEPAAQLLVALLSVLAEHGAMKTVSVERIGQPRLEHCVLDACRILHDAKHNMSAGPWTSVHANRSITASIGPRGPNTRLRKMSFDGHFETGREAVNGMASPTSEKS